MVPILPCIGWSPSGKPYNVPSDEIALEAVTHLGAVKLFIISLSGGLKGDLPVQTEGLESGHSAGSSDGNSYRNSLRLTLQEAERILDHHRNAPWSKPLAELDLALRASRAGVERVHLIDGAEEGAILKELFSNLGTGIMIYGDEYESIRPIRSKDIPDILRLMEPLMRQGILLKRTGEDIQQKKGDYAVFVIDGQIHACGALHNWGEGQGEIAALATDSAWADRGLGSRMVRYFLARAEKAKLHRVFVLTTRTHDWFESLGFKEVPLESLPERKRMAYDRHRRSAIFALDLQEFSPP
jgi:amino-acid N-acetyltransferase